MPTWIWIFILTAGTLFGLKILYLATAAAVLPVTQGALYVSTARVRLSAFRPGGRCSLRRLPLALLADPVTCY